MDTFQEPSLQQLESFRIKNHFHYARHRNLRNKYAAAITTILRHISRGPSRPRAQQQLISNPINHPNVFYELLSPSPRLPEPTNRSYDPRYKVHQFRIRPTQYCSFFFSYMESSDAQTRRFVPSPTERLRELKSPHIRGWTSHSMTASMTDIKAIPPRTRPNVFS